MKGVWAFLKTRMCIPPSHITCLKLCRSAWGKPIGPFDTVYNRALQVLAGIYGFCVGL